MRRSIVILVASMAALCVLGTHPARGEPAPGVESEKKSPVGYPNSSEPSNSAFRPEAEITTPPPARRNDDVDRQRAAIPQSARLNKVELP